MANDNIKKTKAIYWASGIVSICGIIFEVLFGAAGSYILGDGVKQYTLTISLFLTGMGIGASVSEKVTKNLILSFIWIELLIGLIGGLSIFTLFGITAFFSEGTDAFFLYAVTALVGALTGVELPILIRKANEIGETLNRSTARVLFSDYAGGLIGGLLFVYLLRPQLGLVKTAFVVALVNVIVALWLIFYFKDEITSLKKHAAAGVLVFIFLLSGVFWGEEMAFTFEQKLYRDPIVYSEDTNYQQIILTKEQGDLRMFLDGQLQFSSTDEYRYHETLVHPAMAAAERNENILVLGGGDGLAVREILKYEGIKNITLVDLDPKVVQLAKENRSISELNEHALEDERVEVINKDAFNFLENTKEFYDVILVDLPDPNNESLNKLYTLEFYQQLRNHLPPGGSIMVQSTSPTFATEVYWTINQTISAAGLYTENLHVDIPSFGDWGFVLATRNEKTSLSDLTLEVETKFLTDSVLHSLGTFGKDIDGVIKDENGDEIELEINTLINPILIQKYEKAWSTY